ncbi:MAG: HAD-IC family P-type ATPase [Eubacterium sp.]|nr:HAD-IC family P-type ATPase [Eubacterium sp.]
MAFEETGKIKGLSEAEALRLEKEGKSNRLPDQSSQSVSSIIIGNVCTYFNAIFFGLGILVISVGAYRNLLFLPVVIANMIIGIVQQLRAKKVLDSLSLLDVTEYTVIRDGKERSIAMERLVLGDTILLSSGQQIPADAEVVSGQIYANEALLTGESDEVEKNPGAELMSGSFVVSGSCIARLTRVGNESYAAQLTAKAKEVKNKKSEMIRDIERIILVAGIVIIPVGGLLLWGSLHSGHTLQEGVVSMVGAVVGMIPEGLYLLLTVALTMSAARLARNKVLLHDMKSIETLARVDVLCVDKTGTITNEVMTVTSLFLPAGETGEDTGVLSDRERMLTRYIHTVPDDNITMVALRAKYPEGEVLQTKEIRPFSSKTKYSEIQTEKDVYRLGAPEFLLSNEQMTANREAIEAWTGRGQRVLAMTLNDEPFLFVSLANEIRETAPSTFRYFKEQGVAIKVISGDNPLTVSRVAIEAGIDGAENYVDASTLEKEEDYREAVNKYTVFGRVKPEQKKSLVLAMKANGLKVAMTGDGVNDILAMKEADCSIAMGGGSDAARQAAQVVLMDSDFSHMMQIVTEGRRIINNITRSGILFLYKNIFSLLLAVFAIILSLQYPVKPTQISLISGFNIGLPGFLLAMENNTKRQHGRLIHRTLKGALPSSLIGFISVAVLMIAGPASGLTEDEVSVTGMFMLTAIGFALLWRLIQPLNKYRIGVFLICIIGMIFTITVFWDMFMHAEITGKAAWIAIGLAVGVAALAWCVTSLLDRGGKKLQNAEAK